jgi:cytochrome d ubiquinol oxidase subunit II
MTTIWFTILAGMIATYVVLDGFDIGAGIVHFLTGRDERERSALLASIAPTWDGNEVWLLAGGGVLVLAFPAVYATAFSGFYLPLVLVLWLLIGRGLAIELRHQVQHALWRSFWDRIFAVSSVLLAVCFGAALGNVVRGVPLDAKGEFFEPLWTHGGVRGATGILDWYTVLVGVLALVALGLHGALWVAARQEGDPRARARRLIGVLAPAVAVLTCLVTWATCEVQPQVPLRMGAEPWGLVFPALALGGLAAAWHLGRRGRDRLALLGSSAYLAGMLASAAFGLFPYVLPSNGDATLGLTAMAAAAPESGLRAALGWWIPGIVIAIGCQVFVYRVFRGRASHDGHGY